MSKKKPTTKRGRPPVANPKVPVSMRLTDDVSSFLDDEFGKGKGDAIDQMIRRSTAFKRWKNI